MVQKTRPISRAKNVQIIDNETSQISYEYNSQQKQRPYMIPAVQSSDVNTAAFTSHQNFFVKSRASVSGTSHNKTDGGLSLSNIHISTANFPN